MGEAEFVSSDIGSSSRGDRRPSKPESLWDVERWRFNMRVISTTSLGLGERQISSCPLATVQEAIIFYKKKFLNSNDS